MKGFNTCQYNGRNEIAFGWCYEWPRIIKHLFQMRSVNRSFLSKIKYSKDNKKYTVADNDTAHIGKLRSLPVGVPVTLGLNSVRVFTECRHYRLSDPKVCSTQIMEVGSQYECIPIPGRIRDLFPDSVDLLISRGEFSNEVPANHILFIPIQTKENPCCERTCGQCNGSCLLLPNDELLKAPAQERIADFEIAFKEKQDFLLNIQVNSIKNTNIKNYHISDSRDINIGDSNGIIFFPHSWRTTKGHEEFVRHVAAHRELFENFHIAFIGSASHGNETIERVRTTLRAVNISYSITERMGADSSEYARFLCHPQGKVLVTWSEVDYNPRAVYDGFFCNLPHFSSIQSQLPVKLQNVGAFAEYGDDFTHALHTLLMKNWSQLPYEFALQELNGERIVKNAFKRLEENSRCSMTTVE